MRHAERRAQTTRQLLAAAADVFARRGFHAATLDEIAAAAGYTKGAVYANFNSKDALFLALLDRHLDDQLAQIDRLVAAAPDPRDALRDASAEHMATGGPFGLLTLEFWLYAARDAAARVALAERYRRIRDRLATAITERDDHAGATHARSPDAVAAALLAVDAGLFLQHLIDPEAVTPGLRATALADIIDPAPGG